MIYGQVEAFLLRFLKNRQLKGRPGPALRAEDTPQFQLGHRLLGGDDCPLGARFLLEFDDFRKHTYWAAGTGGGKTSGAVRLVDFFVNLGVNLVLLDPLGDLLDRIVVRLAAGPDDLSERLTIIDLRQSRYVTGIDPLSGGPGGHSQALQLLAIIKHQSQSWGVSIEESTRNAFVALSLTGHRLVDIERLFNDQPFRRLIIERLSDEHVRNFFERYDCLKADRQVEMTMAVLNKIAPIMAVPRLRHLFDVDRPFDWPSVLNGCGQIVLVCLGATEFFNSAYLIGGLMVAQIEGTILARASIPESERQPTMLVIDEFQQMASTAFENFIAQGRRLRLHSVLLHQSTTQISQGLGELIRNNVGLELIGPMGSIDARILANDLVTNERHDARVRRITQMKPGEAYVARRGQTSVRVKMLFDPDPEVDPEVVAALREQGLKRFARSPGTRESADDSCPEDSQWEVRHETRPRLG